MEVAQEVTETWEEYFERTVASGAKLDDSAIDTLREDLSTEDCIMQMEEIDDITRHKRMLALAKTMLASYQESAAHAQNVISGIIQPMETQPATAHFPVTNISELPKIDDPLRRMHELMEELRKNGDYQRIRNEFCQLSILLNLQGLLSPAFRPALITGKKFGDRVFKAIHRDRLVIDCHWLHATEQFVNVRSKDVEFQPMFKHARPFPFDLAWKFANKEWKANHRVGDMLRLTSFQQCQLSALRSDEVKEKIERIEHGTRKNGVFVSSPSSVFEQGLNAWCERDRRIFKHRDGYLATWKARAFLGATESVRLVGKLAGMMLGEAPKDDKTIRSREQNIVRHILGE